jgi:hypothetical protein
MTHIERGERDWVDLLLLAAFGVPTLACPAMTRVGDVFMSVFVEAS